MKTRTEVAIGKFLDGYNCAQSVVYAYSDDLGLDKDAALRIACGFGAGMGRKQDVCGAVSGGIFVLGLVHGRGEQDDRAATELTYAKTRELIEKFQQRNGNLTCRRLLNGCELTKAEGQKTFKENDLLNRVCRPCVESVIQILEQLK
ncbi:MAG: C_GCAxxG_C_C family protein [Chloroflexi bacterium]|nr:C_GCAxxG_C_C family protein [Chloroflexota bacterium]